MNQPHQNSVESDFWTNTLGLGLPIGIFFNPSLSLSLERSVIRFKGQFSTVTLSYMLIMSIVVHKNKKMVVHTVRDSEGLVIVIVGD